MHADAGLKAVVATAQSTILGGSRLCPQLQFRVPIAANCIYAEHARAWNLTTENRKNQAVTNKKRPSVAKLNAGHAAD